MPIPLAYKPNSWASLPGEIDTASVYYRETTMEPREIGPAPPTVAFFSRMNATVRGHVISSLAEFTGTFMFLTFSFMAAQIGNEKTDTLKPALQQAGLSLLQITYIASVFAVSLGVNVWVFYRVSGGQFNPAVSLGLWLCGAIDWVRLLCNVAMQFAGGLAAAGLVSALLPGKLQAETSLGSGVTVTQGFFIEVILTAQLVITILMLAVEKSRVSFMAPLAIGLALFVDHLVGINYTGCGVNPARTLGPAVANANFVSEIWIYFVAPPVGAVVAATVHYILKALGYQSANPGQDDDGLNTYRILRGATKQVRPPRRQSGSFDDMGNYNIYLKDLTSPSVRWQREDYDYDTSSVDGKMA